MFYVLEQQEQECAYKEARKETISGSITRAVYARLAADGIVGVFRSKDFHSIQTSSPALSTN